ncbi:MAG: hypothetical protein JWN34_2004 [Bryobacterales bacterium]|nr:hypothetical protein [Bryobacterales bacterium]
MLTIDDLSQAVAAYTGGFVSYDEFEEWFFAASRGKFGEPRDVLKACLDIDLAHSEFLDDAVSESEFQRNLLGIVAPFRATDSVVQDYVVDTPYRALTGRSSTASPARRALLTV